MDILLIFCLLIGVLTFYVTFLLVVSWCFGWVLLALHKQ